MELTTKHTKKIALLDHPIFGILYLAPPSWDCDWYWEWGYVQNKDCHLHVDSYKYPEFNKLLVPELQSIGFDLLEILTSFYTLQKYAEMCNRGGSHIKYIPEIKEFLKNDKEYERINMEVIPQLFDKFYSLIDKTLQQQKNKENE